MALNIGLVLLGLALLLFFVALIVIIVANVVPRRTPEWRRKVSRTDLHVLIAAGIGLVLSFTFCTMGFGAL